MDDLERPQQNPLTAVYRHNSGHALSGYIHMAKPTPPVPETVGARRPPAIQTKLGMVHDAPRGIIQNTREYQRVMLTDSLNSTSRESTRIYWKTYSHLFSSLHP